MQDFARPHLDVLVLGVLALGHDEVLAQELSGQHLRGEVEKSRMAVVRSGLQHKYALCNLVFGCPACLLSTSSPQVHKHVNMYANTGLLRAVQREGHATFPTESDTSSTYLLSRLLVRDND